MKRTQFNIDLRNHTERRLISIAADLVQKSTGQFAREILLSTSRDIINEERKAEEVIGKAGGGPDA